MFWRGGVKAQSSEGLDLINAAHVWTHLDRDGAVYEGGKNKTQPQQPVQWLRTNFALSTLLKIGPK